MSLDPLDALDALAEQRIQEALAAGAFRDLPGQGKPLEFGDITGVPADPRASYLVLKSAGVLPEEMERKHELVRLGDLIAACHDEGELRELSRRRDAHALRVRLRFARRAVAARNTLTQAPLARPEGGAKNATTPGAPPRQPPRRYRGSVVMRLKRLSAVEDVAARTMVGGIAARVLERDIEIARYHDGLRETPAPALPARGRRERSENSPAR